MNRLTSTRGWPIRTAGLLLLAGLLLWGLPASAQAIKVTSAVPDVTDQGTVGLVVTIGGENFGKSSRVNFYVTGTTNPGGITVRNVNYKNPQTLVATIDVAPDAQTTLKFDIQVMSNGRTGKGTELFKVVKPTGCTGCEIVYTQAVNYTKGPQDLMLMNRDGTNKMTLLSGANDVLHKGPAWSPDGNWIAFTTNTSTSSSIRVIKGDGTGLTTVATRCKTQGWFEPPAWRRVPSSGGYWLAYLDARSQNGCLVDSLPGTGMPSHNLWAVHVSLGSPVLAGSPVCLTCDLNAQNLDFWCFAAWSRDGFHFSAFRKTYQTTGKTYGFYIFDVTFDASTGAPALVPAPPFEMPGLNFTREIAPRSWAHWSDSLVVRTNNDADRTYGLLRYEIDLQSVPKQITGTTVLTTGSSYFMSLPVWSPDDQQMVDDVTDNSSGSSGISVITPGPPFSVKLIAPDRSAKMVDAPDWKPQVP
jgi:hypothetical protein